MREPTSSSEAWELMEPERPASGTEALSVNISSNSNSDINRTAGGEHEHEHEPPDDAVSIEDVPPNGGYGWVCTASVFLINAHTWGLNSAWGIFLAHYLSNSTFPNASNLEYSLIGGLSISQALLSAPLVALSAKHLGTRNTLLIGTGLLFVSLFTASYATQIWHLFLSQGVCFGVAMGFVYLPATAMLPQWFSSRRSLAMGIASAGSGLGGLAYNLAAGRLVEQVGVEWTYRVLAFCGLAVNFVCSLLLRDRNKAVKPLQNAFDYREYLRVEVALIIVWGLATELGFIVLLYSLPNYATSIGLTARQGSVVGAFLNLGLGVGRPVVGYYSDAFGRLNMAVLTTGLSGVFCLALWVPAKSYGLLLAFALLTGSVFGVFWACVTPVTAELVGLRRLPSSFGVICFALVVPTTFAETIALEMVDASGYLSAQLFVGFMFLLGAMSTWLLRSWKINEVERKAAAAADECHRHRRDGASQWSQHAFWLSPRKLLWWGRV